MIVFTLTKSHHLDIKRSPKNRSNGRGGGIALIARDDLKPKDVTQDSFTSFEHASVLLQSRPLPFKVVVIYRPPSSKFSCFLEEFSSLIEILHQQKTSFILMGDFNIHVDISTDAKSKRFLELLDSFNLVQHIKIATHTHGHTLDLVISQKEDILSISNIRLGELISDHFSINLDLSATIQKASARTVLMRKTKSIDIQAFKEDLRNTDLISNRKSELNDLVNQYNICLKNLLDKHAPLSLHRVKVKRNPWYSSEIHDLRNKRRKQQRKWNKSHCRSDLQNLIDTRDALKTLISKTKTAYYRDIVQESSRDQGALLRKINALLPTPTPLRSPTFQHTVSVTN